MLYLSDCCLLCLNSKQLESVLVVDNNGIAVQEQLKYCLPEIAIMKSKIPQFICSSCRTTLQSFYKFKQTCLKNFSRLKQYTQILHNSSDSQGQKFTELQIQVNNEDLLVEQEQNVVRELNIKEEIGDSFQEPNQSNNIINDTEDCVSSEMQKQHNNEELLRQPQQEISKLNIEDVNVASSEVRQALVASEETEHHEFYFQNIKNELDNEENSDKQSNVDEANFSADTDNVNKYKCDICNNEFSKNMFNRHLKVHTEINYFKCSICDRKFIYNSYLETHMKIHAGVKEFKCSICDKQFIFKQNLEAHTKIHGGSRDFKCSVCDKKFLYKSHLKVHMKIHAGIKDFKCTICDKLFVQKSNLTQHLKTHERNLKTHEQNVQTHEGNQEFECTVCDKKFNFKHNLKAHMKVHAGIRDHKCSVCHKEFFYQCHLNVHMKIHAGIKDFKCTVCNKTFVQKNNLTQHMKIHEQNRETCDGEFKCALCNMLCASKSDLDEHMSFHTSQSEATEYILGLE